MRNPEKVAISNTPKPLLHGSTAKDGTTTACYSRNSGANRSWVSDDRPSPQARHHRWSRLSYWSRPQDDLPQMQRKPETQARPVPEHQTQRRDFVRELSQLWLAPY